ncbi:hypothetical protein AV521_02335 [Streptomyces sp. IMTB 2501]|uniref:hypothetical protein n=1 Tax=Streptomyces sp. IMTB 2501 TaxID=1776340 RepID=UPI00096C8F1D|nr:hypothetical protein AV521_02335 [Streptomyces sp. IMTB 2501]
MRKGALVDSLTRTGCSGVRSCAGFQRSDTVGYFKNLCESPDTAERMSGRLLPAPFEDHRRAPLREMHAVVVERFGPRVAHGEWDGGVRPHTVPAGVARQDGTQRIGLTVEHTPAGGPLTIPADIPGPPADGAPRDRVESGGPEGARVRHVCEQDLGGGPVVAELLHQ